MLNATATNADSSENENNRRKQVKIVMRVYGTFLAGCMIIILDPIRRLFK
jgi:hypothetical protein